MDAPKTKSWWELEAYTDDNEYWRTRVRIMRQQPVVNIKMDKQSCGQTCGGWQLGTVHGEQLGRSDMLSCKGTEDTVIDSASGVALTHITPRQRKWNKHNTLRRLCHTRSDFRCRSVMCVSASPLAESKSDYSVIRNMIHPRTNDISVNAYIGSEWMNLPSLELNDHIRSLELSSYSCKIYITRGRFRFRYL